MVPYQGFNIGLRYQQIKHLTVELIRSVLVKGHNDVELCIVFISDITASLFMNPLNRQWGS